MKMKSYQRVRREVGEQCGSKFITDVFEDCIIWACDVCSGTGSMTHRGWGIARTCCGKEFHRDRDRLMIVWNDMHSRTSDPNHPSYSRYKGLSISGWSGLQSFKEWALGVGYSPGLDLDRIDNSKGYSPENCRFVSRSQNSRNRSSNRTITAFGETKTLVEWTEDDRCSVGAGTVSARIDRYGWGAERAISKPQWDRN